MIIVISKRLTDPTEVNMLARKVREFLDKRNIHYVSITHRQAFTAQDIAASAHISGKELAKTVMIKADGRMVMLVLPASAKVNFHLLAAALVAKKVELADEDEFAVFFPECEVGAMPPFGNLYGIEVLVADSLAQDETITFNAGTHRELIMMRFADYERLVNPKVIRFEAATV
jgi:Ala-tRNA(Pro) deacylase